MTFDHTYTPQTPLNTGFGARTTAEEALGNTDLTGKIAIVTGGHSGLGLETTRVLAKAGAKVIVPVRSIEKAAPLVASIPGVELAELDLSKSDSIHAFAQQFKSTHRPLHILVHSAGVMAIPQQYDSRGNEMQLSTNYLGPFQLTSELWPALQAAKGARVVIVSSRAHLFSPVDFEDIHYKQRDYDKWMAYGQSKTAASLFAIELDRRGKDSGVRAFAVHPGTIVTNLSKYLSDEEMKMMGAMDEQGQRKFEHFDHERKTIEEGAATIVWCAANEQLKDKGGVYCENVDIVEVMPNDTPPTTQLRGVKAWAVDREAAKRLWQWSEEMLETVV